MPYVSVFMDVEDPINPLADDAARELAALFSEVGVRGAFCVTGEKCRTLMVRRRSDVIEALKPHCLGLHTDTHSYHPTTMELLETVEYSTGCRLAEESQGNGVAAFRTAFGRMPTFWGGAGNTWSPEIAFALRQLSIRAYSYALTEVPGQAVHRFDGCIAVPQDLSISESDWADVDRSRKRTTEVFSAIHESGKPFVTVFVGHPTRFRHERFWDEPYAQGHTPWSPEHALPVPEDVYQRSLTNLRGFLIRLREEAVVIGLDDALDLPWEWTKPSHEDLDFFADRTAKNLQSAIHWPIHRPDLRAQKIVEKTLSLSHRIEIAHLSQ